MASSWNELSEEPQLSVLMRALGRNQVEGEPISCRVCDQVFFDNKTLFSHFRCHFNENGTLKPGLIYRSPEDDTNVFSSSPHVTRSSSVPVNVGDLGNSTRRSVPPYSPNFSGTGNFVVPTLFKNSMKLRGHALTHRPQPYPSPTNFFSPISHGNSSSQPNQSSNFLSGSSSQPIGPPNFRSTLTPLTPGISIARSVQISGSRSSMRPRASASPPIQLSKFQSPISTAVSTSRSVPGTSNAVHGPMSSYVLRPARHNAVNGRLFIYTKPFIQQLEQPLKKMKMSQNEDGGYNNNVDEMDLTLKL